jgi:hypothetical protein
MPAFQPTTSPVRYALSYYWIQLSVSSMLGLLVDLLWFSSFFSHPVLSSEPVSVGSVGVGGKLHQGSMACWGAWQAG